MYEPYPALSNNEGEYMIENPELRPPNPPKLKEKLDLQPKVQIFEVRYTLKLFCNETQSDMSDTKISRRRIHVPRSLSLPK